MSINLLDDLNDLIGDDGPLLEYKHELAMSAFTNGIAARMADQDISQADLARRLGVSRARVSQLMRHHSSPSLRTMVEVANALGCDLVPGLAPCEFGPARLHVTDDDHAAAIRESDSAD